MKIQNFLKSGHTPTLVSAFLYFDVSFMVWVLMGVLGAYIASDFGLSATQKGLVAAIPILGGALVRVPLGLLVDYLGPKKTGILSQLIVICPLVAVWLFARDIHSVFAFGLLLGVAGGSFAVALPQVSQWYPPRYQGMALGITGAGNSGTVLASLFAPRLAEWVGWHHVFGLALIPVLAIFVVYLVFSKENPARPKPKKMIDYFSVLKEPDTAWFSFFYGITFGGFVGLASFLGIFFHDQYGLSKVMAGNLTALCVFAGSFFRPLGGHLADRLGGVKILSFLFAALALLVFAISLLLPLLATGFLIILAMMCLGMGNGAVFQLVPLRFRSQIGIVTGIVGAFGGLGGFFLPALLGFLKDETGSYGSGFFFFSSAALAALLFLRWVQRGWTFAVITIPPTFPSMLQGRVVLETPEQ